MVEYDKHSRSIRVSTCIYIYDVYMISIDIVLINIIDKLYDILVRFCLYGLVLKAPYEGDTLWKKVCQASANQDRLSLH